MSQDSEYESEKEQPFRVITHSDDDSDDISSDDEPSFLNTYSQWTIQENEWLWEKHSQGTQIHVICKGLDRYPDDVIVYMCTHSHLRPDDIPGFGGPWHLALWKEQQEAFQTNPLFNLRKEIQRKETDERICDMLRLLLNRK